jgi:hypothetical protein
MKCASSHDINWDVKFPCQLTNIVGCHCHKVIDAEFRLLLFEVNRKSRIVRLGSVVRVQTRSKVLMSSFLCRANCASMELTPWLPTTVSASP